MKKRILATLAALALLAGATVASAEDATVTVNGGTLSVTAANLGLTAVTLDATDKTTTSVANAWTAQDSRGTGAGWHLTIASTDFTTEDVQKVSNTGDTTDTFTLNYGAGATPTTASIDWDATAAAVKSALELLTDITTVTVTGSGTAGTPWVIRFDTVAVSDTLVAVDTGVGMVTTVALETIDISATDQQFGITLADTEATDAGIGVITGNTKPTSSVTSKQDIADSTVTFASAATDIGMGDYRLNPDFELEVRAEVYAATYTATLTVTAVTAP